jgi:hypothetical protein
MMPKLKALANSHDLSPMPLGMDEEALKEMFKLLGFASDFGYDLKNEFRDKSYSNYMPRVLSRSRPRRNRGTLEISKRGFRQLCYQTLQCHSQWSGLKELHVQIVKDEALLRVHTVLLLHQLTNAG